MDTLQRGIQVLSRKKHVNLNNLSETKLACVLNTLDLTALGIGSTLGAGAYVLSGQVAKNVSGPAIIVSFMIAGIVSVLAGLCYAEFGARVPKAGSAYVYSYITVGEFIAFIIGWNLILEYAIGTASVARAWSANLDSLLNNAVQNFFKAKMPIHLNWMSPYPDFVAFGIIFFFSVILSVGVKQSTLLNNVFTIANLLVLTYVIICGLFKIDLHNWQIKKSEIPANIHGGNGGFIPFGFSSMLSGAATCFYGFVGFDCIATTGEEAKNPKKSIPLSIILSLIIIFIVYFGVSAILTLMCPYYLLDADAPLPAVFERVGWGVAKYIITVGALCALSTSLLGAIFPLPRIIYAMAEDRLLFGFLSKVVERFKTPVIATLLSGFFAGFMALLFNLKELVDMMSIGTLLAYTFVAKCVVILRYKVKVFDQIMPPNEETERFVNENQLDACEIKDTNSHFTSRDLFFPSILNPTPKTQRIVMIATFILNLYKGADNVCYRLYIHHAEDDQRILTTALSAITIYADTELVSKSWGTISFLSVLGISCIIALIIIWVQPQNQEKLHFKVPLVPLFPEVSAAVNLYLMLKLPVETWIRFGVWMALGLIIYLTYGIWHSTSRHTENYQLVCTSLVMKMNNLKKNNREIKCG